MYRVGVLIGSRSPYNDAHNNIWKLGMSRLLYISASPRGGASASIQAADFFLEALPSEVEVERLDLFAADLPEYTPALASAKQKMGVGLDDEEAAQWPQVKELVAQFVAADRYLFAIPMWNFSVPYKFKQYIDLVTHPGLTFTRDEQGIRGLASGPATVIYSRGGDYSAKDGQPDPFDFQSPYMNGWFTLVGLGPVEEVLVQRTMAGPDALAAAVDGARERLESLAQE